MHPGHTTLPEELVEKWTNTELTCSVRRFAVTVGETDVGWFSLVQPRDNEPGAIWLNLFIPGAQVDVQARAIRFSQEQAVEMGAERVLTKIWVSDEAAALALTAGGYELARRARFWRLELDPHAARLIDLDAAARSRLAEKGIAIASVAERGGSDLLPRMHELANSAMADIPSSVEFVPVSFDDWLVWMQPPSVQLDRVWVAFTGETPVGYSFLEYQPSLTHTGFTGVLAAHRNQGIARALKLATLRQAIALGIEAVETDNDSENAPILHLNEELGYVEIPGQLEFHKTVTRKASP